MNALGKPNITCADVPRHNPRIPCVRITCVTPLQNDLYCRYVHWVCAETYSNCIRVFISQIGLQITAEVALAKVEKPKR